MPEINTEQHYIEQQAKFRCKIGDTVRVSHSCTSGANGWPNSWIEYMNHYIGRSGKITHIYNHGIHIRFDGEKDDPFAFPYFVLDLLE